jgi:Large polyvalent protein associated domain 38
MPYLKLPDGRFMEVPEGVSPEEARRKAQENYPMAFADTSKAQTGIGAAFGAGLRGAGSALSTAAAPLFGQTDEEIRQAERKRQALEAERFRGTSLEDVKKAYRESGIFGESAKSAEQHGALRTLLGMWGEQAAQSLPQMGAAAAGGVGGGALAGSFFGPVGTVIGGGLGALAANIPFFTGSNVQAQIRAQEEAGKQEPLSYGRAVAAAVPQAGLEAVETLIPLGRLGVSKGVIAAIESLGAKRGEAELVKAAERSILAATGRGAVKGIGVEVPVEIAQQVLERAQAGKSVLDRDAMNDYIETAVGTVGPGAAFGIAGGAYGRMQARGELNDLRRAQEAERVRVEAAERQRQEALAAMPRGTQQGMFSDLEQFQGPPAPTEEQRNAQLTERQNAMEEFSQLRRHVESLEKQFEAAADNPEVQDQIAAALNRYTPALTEAGKRAKAAGVSDAEITGVLGVEPLDRRIAALDRALAKARSEGDFQKIESLNRQKQALEAQRAKFDITQATPEGQMSLFGEENAGRIAEQESAFWSGEEEALQELAPARTAPGADEGLIGAQEQLRQDAEARAEQQRKQQALASFNRARQQQAEDFGISQNAEKMESMAQNAPLQAVLLGAGRSLQETTQRANQIERMQKELDTGVVHTDTAKLLGIQMPASAYSPLTPQERAEDARQRNQDRDMLRETQQRQRMELQSGRGQDALAYAGMRSLEAVLNPAYGLQDNLQEAYETGQRISAAAKETLDTNENLTADQREELQGRVGVGEALAREAENLLREKHGVTPTGAAAGPVGPVRGGFDLNQKPQAEAVLKAIDTRIAELEQQRKTEFPNQDLVDENGDLTAAGKRYVGNSATLHLLRQLREKAQGAVSREERVSNPRARAAREAKARETALFELANIVDDLRKGEFTGSLPQTMLRKAEELRAKVVDAAIKEAEYRRQADNLAPMSVDEKLKLAMSVHKSIANLAYEAAESYRTPSGAPMPRGYGRETPMRAYVDARIEQMLKPKPVDMFDMILQEISGTRVSRAQERAEAMKKVDEYLRTLAEAQRSAIQRGMTISGGRSQYAQIKRTINEAVDTASNPEREEAVAPAEEETAAAPEAAPTEQKGRVFKVPPSRPIGPPRSLFEDAQTRRAEQQRKEGEALIERLKEQILTRMQELHGIVRAQEADIEKVQTAIAKLREASKKTAKQGERGALLTGFITDADIKVNEDVRAKIAEGLLQQRGVLQFLQSQKFSESLIKEDEKLVFLRDFMHRVEDQINNIPLTSEQLEYLQDRVADAVARAQASQTRPQVTLQERIEKALEPRIVRRTTVRTTPAKVSKAPEGSSLQKIEKRLQNARAKAREIGEKLGLSAQDSLYPYSAPEKGYPTKESRALEGQRQALLQQIRNLEMQMTMPVQEKTVEDVLSAVEQAAGESVALEGVKEQAKEEALAKAARTDVLRFNVLAETLNAVRAAIKNIEKDLKAYKAPYKTLAAKKDRVAEIAAILKQTPRTINLKEYRALEKERDELLPLIAAHKSLNKYKQHRAEMNAEVLQIQARGEKYGYANRLNTALLKDHEVSQELIKKATDTLLARSGGRERKLGAGRPKGGGKPGEVVSEETARAHAQALAALRVPKSVAEEREVDRLQRAFEQKKPGRRAKAVAEDLSPEVADFSEHDVSYFKDIAERSEGQKGITAEEAQGVADRVQESLPDNVNVTYAATVDDIPPRMRAALEKKGVNFDTLQGAVFPSGEVLVVGENHDSVADLEETFAHELVGHYGVDTILGPEGMRSFADRMFGRGAEHVNEVAQALGVQETVTPDMVASALDNPELQLGVARELIAHAAEGKRVAPRFVDRVKQFIRDMVQAVKQAFNRMGLSDAAKQDTQTVYNLIRQAHKDLAAGRLGGYQRVGEIALASKQAALPAGFEKTSKAISSIVAQDQSKVDTFRKEGLLGFETNYLDQLAPVKRIASRMDDTNAAMQMLYYLQRHMKMLTMASTSARYGALKLIKLANGQYRIGSGGGASLKTVDDKLKLLTSLGFTAKQAGNMFTLYLAGLRARVVGFEKLNFNPEQQKQVKDAMAEIEANNAVRSVLDEARKEYNEYNKGMIDFLETTGAITKKLADQLRAVKDYIPYYRVGNNGVLNLMLDSDHPIPMGNVKRQPYLSKLVGGDERIMDYFASSMKNTMLLTNMSLQNLAVRNLAFEMDKLGLTERADPKKSGIRNGDGPDHPNVVRFKMHGEDKYVRLKTEGTAFSDIPVDLMAKGLEGIPITIPEGLKLLSLPAKLLRKGITLNPLYPFIQLYKDSLSMGATRGVSYSSTVSLLKGINKYINGRALIEELQSRGVVSGPQFAGTVEDIAAFRRQILEGEGAIHKAIAAQEANNLRAEGAVRAMLYDSYIKQGMSELEAEYMTEDAMPYSQRGLSPLMRYMSHMVPFFQAQIVGMHSLYKALRGTAIGADKVKMRQKLFTSGLMLSLGTLAYVAAVSGEDWYKKMPEETRLRNWLIKVPWADDPIAIPIQFEFGIVFKATAEAIAQGMFDSSPEGKKMREAYASLLASSIPDLMPQALKPAIEIGVNKDFFSGTAIETPHEEGLKPFMRYRDSTSEIAKTLGDAVGVSPLQIDHLIRGYTGTLGTTVAALVSAFTGPAAETGALPEAAESKLPIVGQLFRSADGNALVNLAVETLKEAETMNATYKELINKGRVKEAEVYLNQNIDMISRGSMYGTLRQRLGEYKKSERAIIDDPSMSARAKRDALLELRKARNEEAEAFLQAFKTAA